MITEAIDFDALNKPSVESFDFSQFESSFQREWDYTLKEFSELPQSTSRAAVAETLSKEDQDLNDRAAESNLIQNPTQYEEILAGYNKAGLIMQNERRASTSLEEYAASVYTGGKLGSDATYLINSSDAPFDTVKGYSNGLITMKLLDEAIENSPSGLLTLAKRALPAIGGSIAIAAATKGNPYMTTAALEGFNAALDTAVLGDTITNKEILYNEKLYSLLSNPALTGDNFEQALKGLIDEIKSDVPASYQRELFQSLKEGPDPFNGAGGPFTTLALSIPLKGFGGLVFKGGKAAAKAIGHKTGAIRFAGKIDVEKMKSWGKILDNFDREATVKASDEVAVSKAVKTAPADATEDEIKMVADIEARKDPVQPVKFESFTDEFGVLHTNEAGRTNIYWGRGTSNEPMTLTEAENMMAVKQMDDANLRQTEVVSSASVKDFKTLKYNKNGGTGSQSMGPGPYGSSEVHGAESRNHYLDFMTNKLASEKSPKPFEIDRMINDLKLDYERQGIADESLLDKIDFKENLEEDVNDVVDRFSKTLGNGTNALKSEIKVLEFQRSDLLNKIVKDAQLGNKAEMLREMYIRTDMQIKTREALLEKGALDKKGSLMTYEIPSPDVYQENWIDARENWGTIEGQNEKVHTKIMAHIVEPVTEMLQFQKGHTRFAASILAEEVEEMENVFDLINAHKYMYASKHWRDYYKGSTKDFIKNYYNGSGNSLDYIRSFDFDKFEKNWEKAFQRDMKKLGIYGVAYRGVTSTDYKSSVNYVLFDPKYASPVKKIEKYDNGTYTQKLLDNGYAIVYDAEKNGYYVVESIVTDPDNKKPFIIKQNLKDFNYSTKDLESSW